MNVVYRLDFAINFKMKIKHFVFKTVVFIVFWFFLCEYAIYYLTQMNCDWPTLSPDTVDKTVFADDEPAVRVMVLADTHLLGSRNGHWFDKLRREWQMHRAFQTAIALHRPELVFVLGDLTDEGLWCSEPEFQYYVKRFHSLFSVPEGTQMYVAVGNHDIGFHYGISPYLNERFESAFNAPAVRMLSVRGNHFVLVNSMALEGDGCFLCRPAELQLTRIQTKLKCTQGLTSCQPDMKLRSYSRPVLMQHYPLFRESDAICDGPDAALPAARGQRFRERWDCLSREATFRLLDALRPRLVVSGHTHHGCERDLPDGAVEITVPSFSWRNKDNPNYLLAQLTPNNYATTKCHMPRESTVQALYALGALLLLLHLGRLHFLLRGRPRRPGRAFKMH